MKHSLAISAVLAIASAGFASTAAAGAVTVEQHGGRNVRLFVPTTVASPAAMIVMLHGCTQDPDGFADATQMDAIAETNGFLVAYPEQPASTISTQCFQWYEPAHQARDAGEPKSIADATNEIVAARGVDPERVYIAGISAGAAMTVILGATYPDVFTALGVVAGLEYKAGTSVSSGFSATTNGGPDPDTQGAAAFAAMSTRAHAVPTFVVQGTADGVVAKVNGDQVAEQWRQTNLLVLGAGTIDAAVSIPGTAGYTFTRMVQRSKANGASVIEYYVVEGMGHAWPGGKSGGSYSDPMGPDASTLLWGFFKGRTRSMPLAVAPVVVPPGTPMADGGTSSSSSGASGSSGTSGVADPGGSSGTSGSAGDGASGSSSSGGCTAARTSTATPWSSLAGLASVLAGALGALGLRSRRKRSQDRAKPRFMSR